MSPKEATEFNTDIVLSFSGPCPRNGKGRPYEIHAMKLKHFIDNNSIETRGIVANDLPATSLFTLVNTGGGDGVGSED